MKKHKRTVRRKIQSLLFLSVIITSGCLSTGTIHAQNLNYKIPNPSKYESLEDVISAAASLIRPLFLLTFGAFILVGAITLITSQGDSEKVSKAKQTMTAAIVGFVIAVFAPTVVNLVLGLIGADGLGLFGS